MPLPLSGFHVTYSVITDKSAAEGDYAENGFITRDCDHTGIEMFMRASETGNADRYPIDLTLREAVDIFLDSLQGRIEPDEYPTKSPSYFTLYNEDWDYSGEEREKENRSLHIPEWVSMGSRSRIARLLGAKLQ